MIDAERSRSLLSPHRFRRGKLDVRAGGSRPAEFGIEGIGRTGWRKQHDRRRFRIDGFPEFHQRQVVDAPSFQRDGALQTPGGDRHARRNGQRGGAIGPSRRCAGLPGYLRR